MKTKLYAGERKYRIAMFFVQEMESKRILTKEESLQVQQALEKKYKPVSFFLTPYVT